MNLKTYRAKSMADALVEVKKDLGKEAVILHTRTFKVGGWMGIGGRAMVEITAGLGLPPTPRERRATSVAALANPALLKPVLPRLPETSPSIATAAPPSPAARAVPTTSARPQTQSLSVKAPLRPDEGARIIVQEELASIKRLVGQVLQCSRQAVANSSRGPSTSAVLTLGPMTEPLFANYMRLIEGQVAPDIAEDIAGRIRDELTPGELADAGIVRTTILRHLGSAIAVTGGVSKAGIQSDGRPLTLALVGPTGVGKTTTVAKLAAAYKLRHGKRVGLVTVDTYRIAAVEQLRTYAQIIGLPLKVVVSPEEIGGACDSLRDCDVIVIDSAGRSQHDGDRLDELSRFMDGAAPHETHLVLSAAAAEGVLLRAADRFRVARPDRAILTKLDEMVHFGSILNFARRTELPLSFVTTGQEVPDHIEIANAERLARRVLDQEVAP